MISRHAGLLALAPRERVLFLCLFVTGASYLSAFLVHRFVELPGIRLGRRWIDAAAPLPRDPGPGAPGGG
jgi:peptidoglycan/LPS O-acetylase OafA/YrhL